MLATYAGTKAFLSAFTASLAEEVKDKGIDVQCLNTYFVVRPLPPHLSVCSRSNGVRR